jgi:hypothetical protein
VKKEIASERHTARQIELSCRSTMLRALSPYSEVRFKLDRKLVAATLGTLNIYRQLMEEEGFSDQEIVAMLATAAYMQQKIYVQKEEVDLEIAE